MNRKIIVFAAVAGTAAMAQAGFGDFLRKAAAISDIVTGTTNATATVAAGQQTADAVANPGQTAKAAAQQAGDEAVKPVTTAAAAVEDAATPGVVSEIEMEELAKLMKKDLSLVLIDVRTKGEYSSGHIPRAKNIPVNSIATKIGSVVSNKAKPIYIYCESGTRSAAAAETLVALGYKRVYNAGAISDWDGKLSR